MSEDPLNALRNSIRSKRSITYLENGEPSKKFITASDLRLSPSLTFPKATTTRLRKPGTNSVDPAANPDDFISLGAVYLAWLYKDVSGAEYMKQMRENGAGSSFVSVTEKKSLVDWLEGKRSELDSLAPLQQESGTPPGSPSRGPGTTLPTTPAAGVKRRYVPKPSDLEAAKRIRANEIELRDRNTVLRGTKPNNFTSIQKVYADKLRRIRESAKSGQSATASTPAKPVSDPKLAARKAKNMHPIIMISSSPTSLITMYNVKKFLQDAVFESPAEAREKAMAEGSTKPEDMIPIYRKKTQIGPGGKEIETRSRYFVVDGTDALGKFGADAWDRVVCVMTTGQAWQFRPYKWSEPRQLFHHVKGVYVSWSNDPPNTKIQDWNVTELKIDQHRRHVDKSVVAHFWKILDTWTSANKPWLVS
ncbi:CDC73-domain-containing protein [Sistotremastrum suecicum HHB10207 ss-3]|uniref:CDC73-domain-containing protein n=1 Tax=Sistotremastrum suecicum HHB10207 ss-3 TaxID=1314776 RepID=A0A165ZD30_9AGAM|nr:CDC73-domain-containing protein [Sistotremastrum suecicum HHB10207 ss-3]